MDDAKKNGVVDTFSTSIITDKVRHQMTSTGGSKDREEYNQTKIVGK